MLALGPHAVLKAKRPSGADAVQLAPHVVAPALDRGRGGDAVREGVQVRERQDLIILPDTTKMRAVVKVQEAQVRMVVVVTLLQPESRGLWVQSELPAESHTWVVLLGTLTTEKFKIHTLQVLPPRQVVLVEREEMAEMVAQELRALVEQEQQVQRAVREALRLAAVLLD